MNNGTENTPHARVVPWTLSDEETVLVNQSLEVAIDLAKSPLDSDKGTGQIISGLCAIIHRRTDGAALGYAVKTGLIPPPPERIKCKRAGCDWPARPGWTHCSRHYSAGRARKGG